MLRAPPTHVPIADGITHSCACEIRGVLKGARDAPGSSDPVSTAARRGDGSHYDDAGYERVIFIRKPSTSTFISRVNSSGVWGRLGMIMFR